MKKNWYAVYTKTHCETKVAALLSKKKIESYCPLNRIVIVQTNKKRMVQEPLFPSFVFVYATETETAIIRQTGSIVNFVYWLGKPVIIKEAEIENMKHFIHQYSNIKLEKSTVNANGLVRIISEPLIDISDNLVSYKNSHFRLLLPSLGYVMMAEIEKSAVDVFNYGYERSKMIS